MKQIKLKVNEQEYYKVLLGMLRILPPFDKLQSKQLRIFAELLKRYNEMKTDLGVEDDMIFKRMLSYDGKLEIAEALSISDVALRVSLSKLNKAGIMKGKYILPQFLFNIEPKIELIFSLNGKSNEHD